MIFALSPKPSSSPKPRPIAMTMVAAPRNTTQRRLCTGFEFVVYQDAEYFVFDFPGRSATSGSPVS